MKTTICMELKAEDYPELLEGMGVEAVELEVKGDGYWEEGKTTGPYGQCHPPAGDFDIISAEILGDVGLDPEVAVEAVGRDVISEKWFEEAKREANEKPVDIDAHVDEFGRRY